MAGTSKPSAKPAQSPLTLRVAIARGCKYIDEKDPDWIFANDLLGASSILMQDKAPFFASILHNFDIKFTHDAESCPTAHVNRHGRIVVNVDFARQTVEKQGLTGMTWLLSHEMLHPLCHLWERAVNHHPMLSNFAHDYVINEILKDEYGFVLDGALYDQEKFGGMTYEQVYGIIEKKMPQPKGGGGGELRGGGGQGGQGETFDSEKARARTVDIDMGSDQEIAKGADGKEIEAGREKWTGVALEGYYGAKNAGKCSAGLARMIDQLREPQVDWATKLTGLANQYGNNLRVTYDMPEPRLMEAGVYEPAEEEVGFNVVIAVDTSGSVSEEQLAQAAGEALGIIRLCGGKARVIVADAEVTADEVSDPESLKDLFKGGGGTAFGPVFERLKDDSPNLLVFITDSYGSDVSELKKPDYPVVWAIYADDVNAAKSSLPFGDVVPIPMDYGKTRLVVPQQQVPTRSLPSLTVTAPAPSASIGSRRL